MELTMRVDERNETRDEGLKVTLNQPKGEGRVFGTYCVLHERSHPEIRDLKVGDRLRVTIEPASEVSEVEATIEEAQRANLHPAMLV